MNDKDLLKFTTFFNRLPGLWWLDGEMLAHWVTNRKLKFGAVSLHISVQCSLKVLTDYCENREVKIVSDQWPITQLDFGFAIINVLCNSIPHENLIMANEEVIKRFHKQRRDDMFHNGLWRVSVEPGKPYQIQLPYKYGTYLDNNWKGEYWWRDVEKSPDPNRDNIWMNPQRKKHGYELLQKMLECGERAGIRDHIFLAFGNLLGYVMYGDFINHDTDMDIGINQEKTNRGQDLRYIEETGKAFKIGEQNFPHGLRENEYRHSNFRTDTNRPLWISVGHRSIMGDNGIKSCNWWFFKHAGYYFHSKGNMWINPGKFRNVQLGDSQAAALGQPEGMLERFTEINFHGVQIKVPIKVGTCLDWWYPGWSPYGKGASAKHVILEVPDWKRKKDWVMYD